MHDETLPKMANQIGAFFEGFADEDEGLDGVANHIRLFWTVEMRRALLERATAPDARESFSPFVLRAVTTRSDELMRADPRPTEAGHGTRPDRSG